MIFKIGSIYDFIFFVSADSGQVMIQQVHQLLVTRLDQDPRRIRAPHHAFGTVGLVDLLDQGFHILVGPGHFGEGILAGHLDVHIGKARQVENPRKSRRRQRLGVEAGPSPPVHLQGRGRHHAEVVQRDIDIGKSRRQQFDAGDLFIAGVDIDIDPKLGAVFHS